MTLAKLSRSRILERFRIFEGGTGGLDSWLGDRTPRVVFDALADLQARPLTQARLNQLLTLSHEAPVPQTLFHYYWLSAPTNHPYDVRKMPGFDEQWTKHDSIRSIDQLYWGLYRFYVDALLFFGNIRTAYQRLRQLPNGELEHFFARHHFDANGMSLRGDPIAPNGIARDNRYLISEMACKSFDAAEVPEGELARVLLTLSFSLYIESTNKLEEDRSLPDNC